VGTMSVPHTPWQTNICDCCSDHLHCSTQCQFFCQSLFCQPCAQGTLQEHAGLANNCCGPCCFYSLCSGTALGMIIPYISLFNLRRAVSEKDNIGESCPETCCCVLCCFPCAMSQLNNHFTLGDKSFKVKNTGCCSCIQYLMGCVGDAKLTSNSTNLMLPPTPDSTPNSMNTDSPRERLIVLRPTRSLPIKPSSVTSVSQERRSVSPLLRNARSMSNLPTNNSRGLRFPTKLLPPPASVRFPQ
jgi:hypothetical protein